MEGRDRHQGAMQNLVQRDTEDPPKSIAILQNRHQILLRLYISVEIFSEITYSISALTKLIYPFLLTGNFTISYLFTASEISSTSKSKIDALLIAL